MGILDGIERGLERAVNGAFARTFRSGVQPVEIASGLKRELDIGSVIVDRDRVLAPNRFVVRLAPTDVSRLGELQGGELERELIGVVAKHARRQGYQLLGEADVELRADDRLSTGVLEIDASRVEGSVSWVPLIEVEGSRHRLRTGTTVVGRGSDADIRIGDTAASRRHLEIIWDGRTGIARDLGSTNGSKIAGQRFREAALSTGTVITIGQAELRFQLVPARAEAPRQERSRVEPAASAPAPAPRPAPQQQAPYSAPQPPATGDPGPAKTIDQDFWRGL